MRNPEDNIELLTLYKIGLRCGIVDVQSLVNFADAVIAEEENPNYLFIEISLCGEDKNKLINVLSEFTKGYNRELPGGHLLGAIRSNYLNGSIDLEDTVRLMYKLKDEIDLNDEEEAFIYSLDDQYYLAADKIIGTIEEVESDLLNFLANYKELDLENHIVWKHTTDG